MSKRVSNKRGRPKCRQLIEGRHEAHRRKTKHAGNPSYLRERALRRKTNNGGAWS